MIGEHGFRQVRTEEYDDSRFSPLEVDGRRKSMSDDLEDVDEVLLEEDDNDFEFYHHHAAGYREGGIKGWFKRRTKGEFCLVLICLLLALFLAFSKHPKVEMLKKSIPFLSKTIACESHGCVTVSANLMENLNTEINPCDNFFDYVCQNWNANHPLEPDDLSASVLKSISEANTKFLHSQILQLNNNNNNDNNDNGIEVEAEKLNKFFQSCMDVDTIEALGASPLEDLAESIGLLNWHVSGAVYHVKSRRLVESEDSYLKEEDAYINQNEQDESEKEVVEQEEGDEQVEEAIEKEEEEEEQEQEKDVEVGSRSPTTKPTVSNPPTLSPTQSKVTTTKAPTLSPTQLKVTTTKAPTLSPTQSIVTTTKAPTLSPTQSIVTTKAPTDAPSLSPTLSPSKLPTHHTSAPTGSPTTKRPTVFPTSRAPTRYPTGAPTKERGWTDDDVALFTNLLGEMQLRNAACFVDIYVGADTHNSTSNILYLTQAGLTLPAREDYLEPSSPAKESKRKALQKYVKDLLAAWMGFESEAEDKLLSQRAEKIVQLEIKLANIMESNEYLRDPEKSYNKLAVEDVQENLLKNIHLETYLEIILPRSSSFPDSLVVTSTRYLRELDKLLSAEKPSVIHDYATFSLVRSFSYHLSAPFRQVEQNFEKAIYGTEKEPDRWKLCMSRSEYYMGFILGRMFVNSRFGVESKSKAQEMLHGIKEAFRGILQNLQWMDPSTKNAALAKIDAVEEKIGFPAFLTDDEKLEEYYDDLTIGENYLENIVAARGFLVRKLLRKLGRPVDPSEWHMFPSTVNAYYSLTHNEMVFPAGILQPPLFRKDFPQAVNYGAIGAVMAHELTHGFDDVGARYDKEGNLRSWWQDKTMATFKSKTECMRKQYSKFKIGGEPVNGNLTLGENIADNGGLKASFYAYQSWRKKFGKEEEKMHLPGFKNLSPEKLFFVSFASLWCGQVRQTAAQEFLHTDPHAPRKYRVLGVLQNSQEFASAFACPVGSPMNPQEKCVVW